MILHVTLMIVGLSTIGLCQSVPEWNLTCGTRETVTRTVGANFSVSIAIHCSSKPIDGCWMTFIFQASDNPDDYKRFGVNEAGDNGDKAEVSLQNGVTFHYEFRKLDGNNLIILNLTVVSSNQSDATNLSIGGYDGCKGFFTYATVSFEGCRSNSMFNVVVPNSNVARYLDVGSIVCNMNGTGRAVFSNLSEAIHTQCDADAKWGDADDISCLYPIYAKLEIDGQPYSRTVEMRFNQSGPNQDVSLSCVTSDAEIMNNFRTFMLANRKINTSSLIVHPTLNGVNVSCYIENNYTRLFGTDHKSTSTLNIKFGPYPPPGHSLLCASSNGSVVFHANPTLSGNSLAMIARGEKDDDIPSRVENCCEMNYGVQGQIITALVKLTNISNLYLRTNSFGIYEYYRVALCETVTIESTTPDGRTKTTIAASNSTELIPLLPILAAVAGILLISLIGCLLWGRHLKKS